MDRLSIDKISQRKKRETPTTTTTTSSSPLPLHFSILSSSILLLFHHSFFYFSLHHHHSSSSILSSIVHRNIERRERDTDHHLLHAHIVHRDLKPQNLLLDESNNLKVSDFGLSALPEQLNNGLLHTACGTPAYTAPEVVRRKGYDGTRADAWSCGVILFIFLAGSLPFNDSNLPNMYRKIYHLEFNMPDWISKLTQNLVYRLLNPNPVTRMSIEKMMSNN
ncbi:hypothetical protein LguiA_005246 [Lonicera macranthoides]